MNKYQPVKFKGDLAAEANWYLLCGGIVAGCIFAALFFYAYAGIAQ